MAIKIRFLPKTTSIIKNEEGAVMIAALLILVLLTIIGIASTNISNTEVKIATHELIHQQNFYRAEGATLQALDLMEGEDNPETVDPPLTWLTQSLGESEDLVANDELYKSDFWDNGSANATPGAATFSDTRFVVVSWGVIEGESLDMGSTKIHSYAIYGRSAPSKRGAVTIEVGYLKAF
jgi:type II secretory pathway pseudopilin PulG